MTSNLSAFAARLRAAIRSGFPAEDFGARAVELFTEQFAHNPAYRKLCERRRQTPLTVTHWSQIPAVPTAAFKELELTCLPPAERTHVFHSSGTTARRPSRHLHSAESLAVYEESLWPWFVAHGAAGMRRLNSNGAKPAGGMKVDQSLLTSTASVEVVILTPPPAEAPSSSLVHMFNFIRLKLGAEAGAFVGRVGADGSWTLDFDATLAALTIDDSRPLLVLGTAFSFVHLLDEMSARNLSLVLPVGSRVLETGGYKGRSRVLPREELHALIEARLGIPPFCIVCEYGMSELSSQAYDLCLDQAEGESPESARVFHFPPWARAKVVSPETGHEVADGETGLLRVFDLANVFSVLAIQTEDLATRCGDGFTLIGRAQFSEPRGCSLMAN